MLWVRPRGSDTCPLVILERVDIAQQPAVRIERRQLIGSNPPHLQFHQCLADAQLAARDSAVQVIRDSLCIRGAQRVIASGITRHCGVNVATSLHEVRQERRIQERHVAGYHQHLFRGRLHQSRIKATQGSGARDTIRNHPYPVGLHFRPAAADDQDVRRDAVQ